MQPNLSLDAVGQELIAEVRDRAISRLFAIVEGALKSADAQALHKELAALPSGIVKRLVTESVYSTLHQVLMWMEETERADVQVVAGDQEVPLRDLSDGLAGELYGTRGWIARFSKCPHREI